MRQVVQNFRSGELRVAVVPEPRVSPNGLLVANVRSLISAGTEKSTVNVAKKSLAGKAMAVGIALHMGTAPARATDRVGADDSPAFQQLVEDREAALEAQQAHGNWGALLQTALAGGQAQFTSRSSDPDRIVVAPGTRW